MQLLPKMLQEAEEEVPWPPLRPLEPLISHQCFFLKGWVQGEIGWLRSLFNPLASKAEQRSMENRSKTKRSRMSTYEKTNAAFKGRWSLSAKSSQIYAQWRDEYPSDSTPEVEELGAELNWTSQRATTSTSFIARTLDWISAMSLTSRTWCLLIIIHW